MRFEEVRAIIAKVQEDLQECGTNKKNKLVLKIYFWQRSRSKTPSTKSSEAVVQATPRSSFLQASAYPKEAEKTTEFTELLMRFIFEVTV